MDTQLISLPVHIISFLEMENISFLYNSQILNCADNKSTKIMYYSDDIQRDPVAKSFY